MDIFRKWAKPVSQPVAKDVLKFKLQYKSWAIQEVRNLNMSDCTDCQALLSPFPVPWTYSYIFFLTCDRIFYYT